MTLDGVPRTLGVRGFLTGVLDGVEVIPIIGVIATGGDKLEVKPGEAELSPGCVGGVRGVVCWGGVVFLIGESFKDREAGRREAAVTEGGRCAGEGVGILF